jgi:hypothetical protein
VSVKILAPVRVTCDHFDCKAEVSTTARLVEDDSDSRTDLNGFLKAEFMVPNDWTWRWGSVYCPAHPFGEVKKP